MTFIRENSEGEYAGSGSWLFKGKPNEVVIQDGVFSRTGCERIIRYAFETARKEKRSLTSISKANALNLSLIHICAPYCEIVWWQYRRVVL